MKALLLGMLLLVLAQSSVAGFFDLSPRELPFSAPDVRFVSGTKTHALKEYKGHKAMLWLFSTWCHTCVASIRMMQEKQVVWKKTGLVILAVRNFNNDGSPGLDMPAFIQKFAPLLAKEKNWVAGEATAEMDRQFNARNFPDIYFLIDEKGFVQVVSTAPTATINKILNFARGVSK